MVRGTKSKRTAAPNDGVVKSSEPDPPLPQAFDIFHRTKMCKFFIMGMCTRGESCQYAHSKDDLTPLPDLKCTKLCSELIQTGHCRDRSCSFAHTRQDLRISATCRNRRHALSNMKDAKGRYGAASECSTAASSFVSNRDMSSEVIPNIPISRSCFYSADESDSASEFNTSEACGTSFSSSLASTSFCSSIQEHKVESLTDKFKKMFSRSQSDEVENDIGGLRVSVKNTFLDFQDDDETAVFKGLRKSCSAEGRLDILVEGLDVEDKS